MNILYLGPKRDNMIEYLQTSQDKVIHYEDEIDLNFCLRNNVDFIISYGYRHIIKKEVLDKYIYKVINLHISYLPWNRGADPNLWSFLEDTPRGVTIHYVDDRMDTGEIIVQEKIEFDIDVDTLRTTYVKLTQAIEMLFKTYWPNMKSGNLPGKSQPQGGTFHKLQEKEKYSHLLVQGWETPVKYIIRKALKSGD